MYLSVGLTFVSLFIALMERLTDPVRRLLSGFDDYFGKLAHAFLVFASRGALTRKGAIL